jgi:hypothetical protein
MAQSVIHLTQSRFYSPVFNAAVFDGPIRIYFAQHHEALALKVYFHLQQYLKETYTNFRKNFKHHGQTVFLMLYPTQESFENSTATSSSTTARIGPENVIVERLGDDYVLCVRGPVEERYCDEVIQTVKTILQNPAPELPLPPQDPEIALL